MALFGPALQFMLPHEGGYSFDPDDAGGETKYGISKRQYPNLDIANLTLDQAAHIYEHDYWAPQLYSQINSQAIANKIFDMAVNMGFSEAHKVTQRALNDCGPLVVVDGVFGPLTLNAVNALPADELMEVIRQRAAEFYRKLALNKPSNAKFLNGWLARAAA